MFYASVSDDLIKVISNIEKQIPKYNINYDLALKGVYDR